MSGAELVEHVDESGRVIELVTRREIRLRRLRHRCAYIVVLDSADRVLVHQRADWKDIYPGWWDVAFGGICGVGEDWTTAARRELAEEAGLDCRLEDIGELVYDEPDGLVIGRVFLARSDDEPTCPDGEVARVERIARAELHRWSLGREVCTDSLQSVLPMIASVS